MGWNPPGPKPAGESKCRWAFAAKGARLGSSGRRSRPPTPARATSGGEAGRSPRPRGALRARAQAPPGVPPASRGRGTQARKASVDLPAPCSRSPLPPPLLRCSPTLLGEPPPAHRRTRTYTPRARPQAGGPSNTSRGSPHTTRLRNPLPPEVDFHQRPAQRCARHSTQTRTSRGPKLRSPFSEPGHPWCKWSCQGFPGKGMTQKLPLVSYSLSDKSSSYD